MFPEVPQGLRALNDLEERIDSARIVFQTITSLSKRRLYKGKRNAVNVPGDSNETFPIVSLQRFENDLHNVEFNSINKKIIKHFIQNISTL